MLEQNTFIETVQGVADIIRTAPKPLSREEILSYFKDMELNEAQKNMVLEYLSKPHDENEDEINEADEEVNETDDVSSEDSAEDEETGLLEEFSADVNEDELIPQSPMFQMYLQELEELPEYSGEEIRDMYKELLAGKESVISTISNIWLKSVLDMAKKLAVTSDGFEDVVQEGNMALFMCLTELCGCEEDIDIEKELFDAIEEAMKSCIREQTGCDEVETTMVGKVTLVSKAIEHLKGQKNSEPTIDEISDYTCIPKEELEGVLELIKKAEVKKDN